MAGRNHSWQDSRPCGKWDGHFQGFYALLRFPFLQDLPVGWALWPFALCVGTGYLIMATSVAFCCHSSHQIGPVCTALVAQLHIISLWVAAAPSSPKPIQSQSAGSSDVDGEQEGNPLHSLRSRKGCGINSHSPASRWAVRFRVWNVETVGWAGDKAPRLHLGSGSA